METQHETKARTMNTEMSQDVPMTANGNAPKITNGRSRKRDNPVVPDITGMVHTTAKPTEDHHHHRDAYKCDNNTNNCCSSSTPEINKAEQLTLHNLEVQVRELTERLRQAEDGRGQLQRQLEDCRSEKELCCHRLDAISAAHEYRIAEMHCVIAELTKRLHVQSEAAANKPGLDSETGQSDIEESVWDDLNLSNPAADDADQADRDTETLEEPEPELCCPSAAGQNESGADTFEATEATNELTNEPDEDDTQQLMSAACTPNGEGTGAGTAQRSQVAALQSEVLQLRAQIAMLQTEIGNSMELGICAEIHRKETPSSVIVEQARFEFYADELEAYENNCTLQQPTFKGHCNDLNLCQSPTEDLSGGLLTPLRPCQPLVVNTLREMAVPKIAERVRLRCASKNAFVLPENITASDLLRNELKNANIVEHLVADLKQDNSIMDSFMESTQFDNELQRLQRKVEHLRAHNNILSLTLDECKDHCEHLYLLCGKYESNAIALQTAVNCSDRAIEAYDVMLALLESKLALMKDRSLAAEESRKAVEAVARHLLERLDSEKGASENSLGPWQSTFNISEKACAPWTADDDSRLRYHVSKLKGRRSTVQNTIVSLESPFSDFYAKSRSAVDGNDGKECIGCDGHFTVSSNASRSAKDAACKEKNTQIDLEMAVLMQELLNLREENIKFKRNAHEADVLREALKQLQRQLTADVSTSQLLFLQNQKSLEKRISFSEAEHVAVTEQQLVEALSRESELKCRIQTLIASMAATQKITDARCVQLNANLNELQKTNQNLTHSHEYNKRKYQTRIRKLEQKITTLCANGGAAAAAPFSERQQNHQAAPTPLSLPHHRKHNQLPLQFVAPSTGNGSHSVRMCDNIEVPETTL